MHTAALEGRKRTPIHSRNSLHTLARNPKGLLTTASAYYVPVLSHAQDKSLSTDGTYAQTLAGASANTQTLELSFSIVQNGIVPGVAPRQTSGSQSSSGSRSLALPSSSRSLSLLAPARTCPALITGERCVWYKQGGTVSTAIHRRAQAWATCSSFSFLPQPPLESTHARVACFIIALAGWG